MKPWETKSYKKKLLKLQDSNALCTGMQNADGSWNYDPFKTDKIDEYYFDFEDAERYVGFIQECVPMYASSFGTEEGDFMTLLDWQKRPVMNIFGWKLKKNGYRRYKDIFTYVPRKNGKSSYIGAIVLAFMKLEEEGGMQIISAANTVDQAKEVFKFVKNAVLMDGYLKDYFKTYRSAVTAKEDMDSYKPISADAGVQDGLNVNLAVMDEVHEFKNEELANVIKTSQGARKQPLYFEITTAAAQGVNYCNSRLEYAQKVVSGEWTDDTFLPVLFYLTEKDEWADEANWYKVNPSLGITKNIDYMRDRYNEAQLQPTVYENNFKRKELNIVTASMNKFLDLRLFRQMLTTRPDLQGKQCYGGLDLGYKDDMCALILQFPEEKNFLLPFFWMPRGHKHFDQFYRFKEYITFTDGDAIDFIKVRQDILALSKKYRIVGLAYDPWFATELMQELGRTINVFEVTQSLRNMSEPLKSLSAGVVQQEFSHDGNECLEWMIGNGEIEEKGDGLIKLVKPKGMNTTINKIDGLIAWTLAHYLSVHNETNISIYESRSKKGESFF